ncbi:mannosidase [Dentipellis sp. KUC8613]|nr:mannosidase [Dentipellis sp. KUC8613]
MRASYTRLPRLDTFNRNTRLPLKTIVVRFCLLPLVTIAFLWTIFSISKPEKSTLPHSVVSPPIRTPLITHEDVRPIPPGLVAPFPPPPANWDSAAQDVKQAFILAYHAYEEHAFPHDELMPLTPRSVDNFGGWGVSVFDSLDTMLLMNLTAEYERGMALVAQSDFSLMDPLDKHRRLAIPSLGRQVSFFETTIRYLGGMLSAYALSHDRILAEKADELGRLLAPVFKTPSGLPRFDINTDSGETRKNLHGVLAEVGSCMPEYTYLAKVTGKKEHYDRVTKIMKVFAEARLEDVGGMLPSSWLIEEGQPNGNRLSLGASADSGHEYLLKQYLLTAGSDKAALEMYLRTTTHILTHLLYMLPSRNMMYPTWTSGTPPRDIPQHNIEHLACFLPGLLALGVQTLPLDNLASVGIDFASLGANLSASGQEEYTRLAPYNLSQLHLWAAEGIAEGCYMLYADSPSGLSADEAKVDTQIVTPVNWFNELDDWRRAGQVGIPPGVGRIQPVENVNGKPVTNKGYTNLNPAYELRPETIESLYMLWRATGDVRWREYGWNIFQAIERNTKTGAAYAAVVDVGQMPLAWKNSMPSYFLAETLKYLYLLFLDDNIMPSDKWVFNTEAHPFPRFSWTDEEKRRFGIP